MNALNNKSILIVDDDPGMLRALEKVLTGEGAAVTCAEWAGEAMDLLAGHINRFDLVITDLRMPFVTGTTVVYGIHRASPALPIIVLTAFGSPEVKVECKYNGVAAFLEKPLDPPQLLHTIEDVFKSQWNEPATA